MTHDLLKNVIDDLGGQVERIVVCELKENTFYATIHLALRAGAVDDRRPALGRDRARAADAGADLRRGGGDPERPAASRRARRPMDVGRLQKWLEDLSDDELGKYKM